jgi:Uma2 family endonuclease
MIQQLERTVLDPDLIYPESDGKPLADNTIQFGLIMTIQGGIDALFADDPDVFVAGDLFWYPVEGTLTRQAPDVMVVFGRPKGDRRSYKQWEEGNIAPQVVFEILSKSNTRKEMQAKFDFYQNHGVDEYYVYDPDKNLLKGWVRTHSELTAIDTEGWISPRLGVRFETQSGMLELYKPNGKRFQSFVETTKWAEQADLRAEQALQRVEQEAQRAEQEAQRAEQEAQRAEQEAQRAEQEAQRAEQEAQRAEQEAQRAEQEAQTRHRAISRLLGLGLTVEQVAEALEFSVEEVRGHR